ncbi:histone protein, partial [[Kitasatospora] papulosa]
MEDQTKVTLAAAVVGGYVLGRTKKGRLALSIATYLAGRRFGLEPRQIAAEGVRRLSEMPQFAELQDQLKGEVLESGRKALTAAADRGMNSLADALSDRTARLGAPEEGEEEEDEGEYEDEEEPEDEDEDEDEEGDEYEEEDEEPEEPEEEDEEEEPEEEEEEESEDEEPEEEEEEESEDEEPEEPRRTKSSDGASGRGA